MRKILFLTAAVLTTMLLASCNRCTSGSDTEAQPHKEPPVVITSTNFEEAILSSRIYVGKKYPEMEFFEASCKVAMRRDGAYRFRKNTFRAVFGNPYKLEAVIYTIKDDTLREEFIRKPWLGDRFMTPFVNMSLQEACDILSQQSDMELRGCACVFRFQIYDGIYQPQYIFGSAFDAHTVNVYDHAVDAYRDSNGNVVVTQARLQEDEEEL